MKILKIKKFKGGWFIGDFKPTILKTKAFEVCYKLHPKGEKWPVHYHKVATEYNLLVRGKMKIKNKILKSGDIFIIYPNEVADPVFIEDCEVMIIKTPSKKGDKYNVKL